MSASAMPGGPVHMIVFAWRRAANGQQGIGPVASSMPTAECEQWHEQLLSRITLPEGDRLPSTCYLRFGEDAVLLLRQPAKAEGRDTARTVALIGPAKEINFDRAVALRALADPPEWGGGGWPEFPAGPIGDSDSHIDLADIDVGELVALVALILREPLASFTIKRHRTEVRALLWAARECLGHLKDPLWTFSTSETKTADQGLPQFVFTSAPPDWSGFASSRQWLDLSDPPERSEREQAKARRLVLHWIDETPGEPDDGSAKSLDLVEAVSDPVAEVAAVEVAAPVASSLILASQPLEGQPTKRQGLEITAAPLPTEPEYAAIDGNAPTMPLEQALHAEPLMVAEEIGAAGQDPLTVGRWHSPEVDPQRPAGVPPTGDAESKWALAEAAGQAAHAAAQQTRIRAPKTERDHLRPGAPWWRSDEYTVMLTLVIVFSVIIIAGLASIGGLK